jgi:hypothetical protein
VVRDADDLNETFDQAALRGEDTAEQRCQLAHVNPVVAGCLPESTCCGGPVMWDDLRL